MPADLRTATSDGTTTNPLSTNGRWCLMRRLLSEVRFWVAVETVLVENRCRRGLRHVNGYDVAEGTVVVRSCSDSVLPIRVTV